MRLVIFLCLCAFACGDDSTERTDSGAQDGGGPDVGDDAGTDSGPCQEGDPCNADDNGCTMDICRRGRCVLGTNSACDDGASCTIDECRSTGPMTFECDRRIGENFCAIDAMCFRDTDPNPANLCQVCVPEESQMTWMTLTAECDDQNECTMGDTCESGECIGVEILDAYEENESIDAPARLEAVSDNDTFPSGADTMGTIYPEGDVDWYVYRDNDERLGRIFPRVDLENIPSGSNYELCAFISCTENETEGAECLIGEEAMMGDLPGCCSNADANLDESVRIDHSCRGGVIVSDDTTDVFVRVRQVEGPPECSGGYTLLYGDD